MGKKEAMLFYHNASIEAAGWQYISLIVEWQLNN